MMSLQGHFLVAVPHQLDPNFIETVILVVRHTERGAFGVVVNCLANERNDLFWERAVKQYGAGRCLLHFGGPVAGPLMALHTDPLLAEVEVLPHVFFTGDSEHVVALLRQAKHRYKVFLGYAGWGPGQLEYEVEQGVWRTAPAIAENVLSARDDLWNELSRRIRESVLQAMFHIRHIPQDPLVN